MNINFSAPKKTERSSVKKISKLIERRLCSEAKQDNVQVMVTEVQCFEPDCVPIETLVILLGSQSRWADKILKPISEVTEGDVTSLAVPDTWPPQKTPDDSIEPKGKDVISVTEDDLKSIAWAKEIAAQIESMAKHMDPKDMRAALDYLQSTIAQLHSSLDEVESKTATDAPVSQRGDVVMVTMKPKSDVIPSVSSTATGVPSNKQPISQKRNAPNGGASLSSNISSVKSSKNTGADMKTIATMQSTVPVVRHKKGVRQRGCPCCDPDNMDNIIDKLLYLDTPP
mmetsp:Transcript_23997/g.35223  ORF Transcript_23997/g.35223 Transcript_23997/m.35223 type:complete len:284 (+) Transcript_23997:57-908(+)